MRQETFLVGDSRFHAYVEGPKSGPLALCMHGFPDTAWTWRHLLPALANNGFYAVAPHMRGYAPTQMGSNQQAGVSALGQDANKLHYALAADERAVLIGHDWGAAAAYSATRSKLWNKVVGVGWPPGGLNIDLASAAQMRRSWYTFFFQLPNAAEVARANDFDLLDRLWADWSPGYTADSDRRRMKYALRDPDNLQFCINNYRELFQATQTADNCCRVPTLSVHGQQDGCIGSELISPESLKLPPSSCIDILERCGHFPQLEKPEAFNRLVLQFLTQE
jgi:pimeloyl-ACP methyl ester carboxylesterase